MQKMSALEYKALCESAVVLADCKYGPKILQTADNKIVKIFYPRKKKFSSSKLRPHAQRFSRNSRRLAQLHIPAVHVEQTFSCPEENIHLVIYPKVPGEEVRHLVSASNPVILTELATYIAQLHYQGIFFRGIHLGNVLRNDEAQFYLIDIADLKVRHKPLNIWHRIRNLRHMIFYDTDIAAFKNYGIEKFIDNYLSVAKLSKHQAYYLKHVLNRKSVDIIE